MCVRSRRPRRQPQQQHGVYASLLPLVWRAAARTPAKTRVSCARTQHTPKKTTQLWAAVSLEKPLKLDFSGPKYEPADDAIHAKDVRGAVSAQWGEPGAVAARATRSGGGGA